MKLVCPHCGREGKIPASVTRIPSTVRCPGCNERFSTSGMASSAESGSGSDGFLDGIGVGFAVTPEPAAQAIAVAPLVAGDPEDDSDDFSEPPPLPRSSKPMPIAGASATVTLPEKEPWYYEFLFREAEGYRTLAKALVYIIGALWLLWSIWFISNAEDGIARAIFIATMAGIPVAAAAYGFWHTLMLVSARIHLGVDHARNDRRTRLMMERNKNL